MKCKWAFIIFIAVSFYVCKKDVNAIDTSTYYIKAAFNGTEKLFSEDATATDLYGDLTADFIMSAKNNNSTISLVIQHAFDTTVTKGTYEPDAANHYFNPDGDYMSSDSIIYASGGAGSLIKITILNLTKTIVTGSFNGVFKNTNDTTDSISITNGEFNLPVH